MKFVCQVKLTAQQGNRKYQFSLATKLFFRPRGFQKYFDPWLTLTYPGTI